MSMPEKDLARGTPAAHWLGFGLAVAALGTWLISVAPDQRQAPHSASAAPVMRPVALVLEDPVASAPFVLRTTASPYDVMVALAEFEALGDALAAERSALLLDAEAAWIEASNAGSAAVARGSGTIVR